MEADPIAIADEIVYGVEWNHTSSDEFHPELELKKLHAAIASAIRDAYERAAREAEQRIDPEWPGDDLSNQARSIASAIRALKGEGEGGERDSS